MNRIEFREKKNTYVTTVGAIQPLETFWYDGSAYVKLHGEFCYREENEKVQVLGQATEVRMFASKIIIEEL